ncbi:MAG: carboxypeptidase regulatory-like domain-containing protein [Planctomycetes bacterium]|nr:carboxypeptidase regulatory-like domain-containing protein [Planctomycetota bacterium]
MRKAQGIWFLAIVLCWLLGAYFLWTRSRAVTEGATEDIGQMESAPRVVEEAEAAARSEVLVEPGPDECLVAGTVVAGEAPVAGAVVRAVLTELDWVALERAVELARCTSDAGGRFELVMAARDCVLVGEAEGLMSKHGVYVFAGPEARVRDVVVPLSAAHELRGTVRTAGGAPVAGRKVELARPDWPQRDVVRTVGEQVLLPVYAAPQVTDAAGSFGFRLPEGEWWLRVREGGTQTWMGEVRVPAEGPLDIVDEEATPRRDESVVLVEGVVQDESGAPVVGAEVRKMYLAGVERTDEEGRFSFSLTQGERSGLRGLLIRAPGCANTMVRDIPRRGADSRVEIALPRGFRIAGRVVDPAGGKVSGLVVEISTESQGKVDDETEELLHLFAQDSVRTDLEGAFAVAGLRAGCYRLLIRGPSAAESVALRVEAGSEDVRLVIGDTGARPVILFGRVMDGRTGTPMEGAEVSAWDRSRGGAGWEGRTTTGQDGRFRLSVLQEGNYHVRARKPGCVDVVLASGPLAPGEHEFEVVLFPRAACASGSSTRSAGRRSVRRSGRSSRAANEKR